MAMSEKITDFLEKINATYKSEVVGRSSSPVYGVHRFSSGILPLDIALGGGWPFGRIGILAGNESTGKTLISLKAAHAISNYDKATRKHRDLVDPDKFTPCSTLFVDVEGTFDAEWANKQGWNPDTSVIARPDYAEQAIDIIDFALRENTFDLIVLDSIAALTPTKEVTDSAEDWQMGLAARLVNKAMRKWSSSLNKTSQEFSRGGPFLLCLNQIREKLGVMYGDPRVLPGGKGQLFASSLILWTKSAKVLDDPDSKASAFVTMGGVAKKNKTFIPNREYAFQLALTDTSEYLVGDIDNDKTIVKFGKKYGVLNRDSGFGCEEFRDRTEDLFRIKLRSDPEFRGLLYKRVLEAALA
jgi:recombination protein RecA